jgi:mRNA interferase RelE/StbE
MTQWKISSSSGFDKSVSKLDPQEIRRLKRFLERLQILENPRVVGKSLTGNLGDVWRYRVGDYRLLVTLDDAESTIVALAYAHRSRVYLR